MKVLFMGEGLEAQEMLQWTINHPKIEIVGVVGDDLLRDCAEERNCKVLELEDAYQKLQQNSAWIDLGISYLYRRILKTPIIDVPQYGCINFHPAPLPDYRGRGGCSFAILDKLSEWGCTAHYVDAGIDTGAIIDIVRFGFDWHTETGISLKAKTCELQKEQYKRVLSKVLANGILNAQKQPRETGRYISKSEMLSAMEIQLDKDDVDAKIQAFWFPPHEGAYIEIKGKRYFPVNKVILEHLAASSTFRHMRVYTAPVGGPL